MIDACITAAEMAAIGLGLGAACYFGLTSRLWLPALAVSCGVLTAWVGAVCVALYLPLVDIIQGS